MRFWLLLIVAMCLRAQDPWKPLQFLMGQWVGEGNGACSFDFDLERKVLIRKSYAGSHHDLTVIYADPASKGLKAIYFDNEDHVIEYKVESGPDSVRFLNEGYRLTYRKAGEGKVTLDFDIAPPGKPFANYIHAVLKRP
jgi:hypothetical protein